MGAEAKIPNGKHSIAASSRNYPAVFPETDAGRAGNVHSAMMDGAGLRRISDARAYVRSTPRIHFKFVKDTPVSISVRRVSLRSARRDAVRRSLEHRRWQRPHLVYDGRPENRLDCRHPDGCRAPESRNDQRFIARRSFPEGSVPGRRSDCADPASHPAGSRSILAPRAWCRSCTRDGA
jgi:hypothetical protein